MHPMPLCVEASGTTTSGNSGSSSSWTAVDEPQTAAIPPPLSRGPVLSTTQLPVKLCIAELAWVVQPVLLWQLNLRRRKLGLEEAEHLGFAFLQTLPGDIPQEVVAKNKKSLEDLLISKGGTVDMTAKAALQWPSINGMVDACKTWRYPLGRHFKGFDEGELVELEQLIQQPEFAHVKEAAQILLLVARDVIAAAQ